MKFNDISEAPMGMLNQLGQKVLSKIPGSIGARAQGKLDTGKVANQWEKEFVTYLGRIGQKNPSTETLAGFLKTKGFSDEDLKSVIGESRFVYERVITNRELDSMILKAAQLAAGGGKLRQEPTFEPTAKKATPNVPASSPSAPTKSVKPIRAPQPSAPTITSQPSSPEKQTPTSGVNNYLNSWARDIRNAASSVDKMALAREMIKFLADRKGTPEAKMLAKAAEMVIKRLGDPALANVVKGFKGFQMERANYVVANYILSEVGLTWKDLGLKIVLSESTTSHVIIAYY